MLLPALFPQFHVITGHLRGRAAAHTASHGPLTPVDAALSEGIGGALSLGAYCVLWMLGRIGAVAPRASNEVAQEAAWGTLGRLFIAGTQ